MTPQSRRIATASVTAFALLAYALLTHYVANLQHADDWAIALAVTPSSLVFLSLALRFFAGSLKLLPLVALGALFSQIWPYLHQHIIWIYFFQHILMFGAMGIWFGRSLFKNRQALCTFFASFVHERMSPALLLYTRQITIAWTGFFFGVAGLSILLFFFAPHEIWSFFANVLSLPLVVLMFVAEYIVRKRVLPPEDMAGITSAFRGYMVAIKAQGNAPDIKPIV